MKEYQDRVTTEKHELDIKIAALSAFLGDKLPPLEDKAEQARLFRQLGAMKLYSDILQERILSF